jgi:cytochrome b
MSAGGRGQAVLARVWDAPTRLFHWLIVVLIATSWWTAENDRLNWHRLSGYAILGLLAFRLYWGVVGSDTARFAGILRGPRAAIAHARRLFRREPPLAPGHSPLGGWSVAAMIAGLVVQVSLGLFAVDIDGLESGPLSHFVDFDTARLAAKAHHIVFAALEALIALHIAAIIFYLVYARRNLVSAMITGQGLVAGDAKPARMAPLWRVAPGVLVALALTLLIASGLRF